MREVTDERGDMRVLVQVVHGLKNGERETAKCPSVYVFQLS